MGFTVTEAGGPGGACGLCYELTPVSNTSQLLDKQAMTFMIIDECPASANPSQKQAGRSSHCGQCQLGDVNDYGQPFHFDLAVDAMTKDQYDLFFTGVTGGRYASFLRNARKLKADVFFDRNWNTVVFQAKPCCSVTNPLPPIETWGCLTGCKNNEAAEVCKNIGLSGPTETMASRMPDTTMTFPVVLPTPGGTTTITAPLGGTTGTGCPSNGTSNSNGSYIVRTVTMTGNIPGPTVSYFYTVTAAAPSGSSSANSTTSKASVSTIYEFYGIRIGTVVGLMVMLLVLQ